MKREDYRYYAADNYFGEESEDVLLSVREIADMHGISFDTLVARLNMDCPLSIATQMPEDWLLLSVTDDKNGNAIFHIAESTYRCSGEILLSYIHGRTE